MTVPEVGSSADDFRSRGGNPTITLLQEGIVSVIIKDLLKSRTFEHAPLQEMLHTGLTRVLVGFAWQPPVLQERVK